MIAQKAAEGKKKYKVFIIDDHPIVCEGLTQLIDNEKDLTVCGSAGDVSTSMHLIEKCKPDIVIADLTLEFGSGLRLIDNLAYSHSDLPILVLTMHDESIYAERCLKAGARGYIMKETPSEKMVSAIRTVLKGEIYISDQLRKKLLNKFVTSKTESYDSSIEILSNRELEVYQLFGKWLNRREIAEQLNLSVKTVETYVENIKKKMNFKSSRELLIHAFKFVNENPE